MNMLLTERTWKLQNNRWSRRIAMHVHAAPEAERATFRGSRIGDFNRESDETTQFATKRTKHNKQTKEREELESISQKIGSVVQALRLAMAANGSSSSSAAAGAATAGLEAATAPGLRAAICENGSKSSSKFPPLDG